VSVDQTLAETSNLLVYSAMTVYTGAFIAFAVDLSSRGKQAAARRAAVTSGTAAKVPVGAGSSSISVSSSGPASPGSPDVPYMDADTQVRRPAAGIAMSLTWLAFLLHAGAVLTRGLSAHRVPWSNMYEFSITGSLVVTAVFLALVLRRKELRYLGTFVIGPVLLTLGLAIAVLYTASAQLAPALQSYWLVIHVSVAFIASALLTISFSTSVLQLVQGRREAARALGREPRGGRFMDGLPGSEVFDRITYRLIAVSFPLWTFTVIAGAIWAEKAWGRYWGWDPKEVWSFVIWVVYAGYLHAKVTRGWEGRRAAYFALAGFACLLINYGVVNLVFAGKHSYAGVG
jgi:cytochrome c-type biogenesis protein CcsB